MANNLDFTFTGKDKTQQAFQSLNRSVSKTQKGFDKLKGAISFLSTAGGVALVGTFGAMATSLNKTADRIGKVSSKLGVSTEALQKLQFSAEQSGVSTETLNMAFQRFTRRIADARQGTGTALKAFQQMGISLQGVGGRAKTAEELFFEVADSMKGMGSETEKVSLAFKFFDSEGVSLVNMLQNGSGALKDYGNQLESVGGIIDSKAIKATERFNDALNLLSKASRGIFSDLVLGIDDFINRVPKALSKIEKFIGGEEFKIDFTKALGMSAKELEQLFEASTDELLKQDVVLKRLRETRKQMNKGEIFYATILEEETKLNQKQYKLAEDREKLLTLISKKTGQTLDLTKDVKDEQVDINSLIKVENLGIEAVNKQKRIGEKLTEETIKGVKSQFRFSVQLRDNEGKKLGIVKGLTKEQAEQLVEARKRARLEEAMNQALKAQKKLESDITEEKKHQEAESKRLKKGQENLFGFIGKQSQALGIAFRIIGDNLEANAGKLKLTMADFQTFGLNLVMQNKKMQKSLGMVFGFVDSAINNLIPGLEDTSAEASELARIAQEIDAEVEAMSTSIDDFAFDIKNANSEMKALAGIEKTYQERVKKANELDAEHLKYYAQIEKDLGILAYRVGVLRSATQAFASSAQQFLDAVATEGFTDIQKRFFAMVTGFERGTQKAFGDIIEQADKIIAETPLNPEKMVEAFKEIQKSMQMRVAGQVFSDDFFSIQSVLDKFGITKEDTPIAGLMNEIQAFLAKGGAGQQTPEVIRRMTENYLGVIEKGITAMDAKIDGYNEAVKAKTEAEAKLPEALKGLVIMLKDVMETEFQSGATKEQLKLDVDALEETFKGLGIGIEELKTFIDSLVKIEQPSGAMGGLVKKYPYGGKIYGPSHGAGGVNANLEGGEFVMSRSAVKKYGSQFMSSVNNGSMGQNVVVNIYDGTGQKISEFESGLRVEINQRANRYNEFPALSY